MLGWRSLIVMLVIDIVILYTGFLAVLLGLDNVLSLLGHVAALLIVSLVLLVAGYVTGSLTQRYANGCYGASGLY